MFRFREGFCDVTDYAGYSRLLIITWGYVHDGSSGIPDEEELSQLKDFENHFVDAFEHDFLAVLTAVLTENGTRQWWVYTSDVAECERRINAMPQLAERYPIELAAQTDTSWEFLKNKIKTICCGET